MRPLMRLRIGLALLLTILGCEKAGTKDTTRADAADRLWALAPDRLAGGIVVGPGAIAVIDPVIDKLRALAKDPELGVLQRPVAELDAVLGGARTHLADAGFALDQGFAFFQTDDGALIGLIPMADRDKLVATLKGTRGKAPSDPDIVRSLICQPIGKMYACTKDTATFDRIGKGTGAKLGAKLATSGGRGDVEVYFGKSLVEAAGYDEAVATIVVTRGQVELRGFMAGKPTGAIAPLVTAVRPRPELANPAGFVVANLAPLLAMVARAAPDVKLPGDVTPGQLIGSMTGQITATMAAGLADYSVKLALTDPRPFTALVAHCSELAPMIPLAAQQPAGACRVAMQSAFPIELDVWVEGSDLRIASHKGPLAKGTADVTDPLATELAAGGWSYAMWGRGSMFATGGVQFPPMPGAMEPQAALVLRALGAISEVGLGVKIEADGIHGRLLLRTIWSNPPEVADKLAAITADTLMKNQANAPAKAIADGAPSSPFATDFAAGQSGMMAPVAATGMLAAIAIPAFMDYRKKAKAPGNPD